MPKILLSICSYQRGNVVGDDLDHNRDLYYSDTSIQFLNSNKRSPIAAHPRLELNRGPAIVIDFDELPPELENGYTNALFSDATMPIRLANGRKLDVAAFFPNRPGGTLIVRDPKVYGLRTQECVSTIHFALINDEGFIHPDSMSLEAAEWEIDFSNAKSRLNFKPLGYQVTHWGSIKRGDGQSFHIDSAEPVLGALGLFFSFVRGGYCGISLINGTNESGERVWEQWSVSRVTPRRHLDSWFEPIEQPVLREVFQRIWDKHQSYPEDPKSLLALQWYLESNLQESSLNSIILTQAALERLAFIHAGDKIGPEGAWIAKALKKLGISVKIPPQLAELEQWSATYGFEHGPRAIVEVRNDLIHHEMRRGILPDEVYLQARALGLWYVELLLLKQFGYQGKSRNRLTEAYETMPWSGSGKREVQ